MNVNSMKDIDEVLRNLSFTSFALFIAIGATCIKLLLIPTYFSTDFDVHRNWLAITSSLPLSKWYYEATSEWTLDYPPFFAYFEWFLSLFAPLFDPKMLIISAEPYRSTATIMFQRLSVIFTDFLLIFAVYKFLENKNSVSKKWHNSEAAKRIVFVMVVLNPGLFYVDHIHFQYNGMLMGILILSIAYIQEGNDLLGAFFFAVALNFKHLFLYCAPVYFIYLLSHYCFTNTTYVKENIRKGSFVLSNFIKLGIVVLLVCGVSLGPFLIMGQIPQLLSRLFPFGRGLCHAYWAPNFWALYNALDRTLLYVFRKYFGWQIATENVASSTAGLVGDIDHLILPSIKPNVTIALILISMLPMLVKLFRKPSVQLFKASVALCSLCFYMFGWHVHEKAILMATIPLSLLFTESVQYARIGFILSTVGHYSLFPLLFLPTETTVKICFLLSHTLLSYNLLDNYHKPLGGSGTGFYLWKFETLYLIGLGFVQLFYSVIHPLYFANLPFLGLLLTSVYCSIGIIYSYLLLYWTILKA